MRLQDRVALITGAAGGIGLATALAFAREGARVSICDIQDEKLHDAARQVEATGCETLATHADVTDPNQVESFVATTVERFGAVDILVNNALRLVPGPLESLPLEDFQAVMDIGVKGYFMVGQAAGKRMIEQGRGGVILHIASIGGLQPYPLTGAYSICKAAQIMLARSFAMEWAKHGIRAVSICPGQIHTPMTDALYTDPDIKRGREEVVPLKRIGTAEEVAEAAVFLASDDASYITSTELVVDGGTITSKFTHVPGRRWSGRVLE
jgi:NAD(P)-dependent dehydrogenase (short-subunit alcohol dehydrogenase family)